MFDREMTDNYYWLRERNNPEVIEYLEAENAYTDMVMKPTENLQETLYDEMLGRIKETDLSVPVKKGKKLLLISKQGLQKFSLISQTRKK